jgi:hypothetical protein
MSFAFDSIARSAKTAGDKVVFAQIEAFANRPGNGCFPRCSRTAVAQGLQERMDDPGKIQQGVTGTCGAASFLYSIARSNRFDYMRLVMDLYDKGIATLGTAKTGTMTIKPSTGFRNEEPPPESATPTVDWITLGSLRDSENWLFEYHLKEDPFVRASILTALSDWVREAVEGIRGYSTPGDLESWFRKVGYTRITNRASTIGSADWQNVVHANAMQAQGHHVCLLIDADVLYFDTLDSTSLFPNHWVVLTSQIKVVPHDSVQFSVFTYGNGKRQVPSSRYTSEQLKQYSREFLEKNKDVRVSPTCSLSQKDFLNHYYGFVSAGR